MTGTGHRFRFKSRLTADLGLIGICVIWGTSFPLVKAVLSDMHPLPFLAVRFGLGALLLAPLLVRERHRFDACFWRRGFSLGVFMFAGMATQTVGLRFTSASHSGFLTALSVVFVPLWVIAFERKWPGVRTWTAIAMAALGVCCLTATGGTFGLNRGDWFTILSAAGFSLQIIFIEIWVRSETALAYAWIMLTTTAVLAAAMIPWIGPCTFRLTVRSTAILVFLAVYATALAFWGQTRLQPKTTATAAAVVYATEPIFAALFASVLLGERLGLFGWIGAALILSGILVHESALSAR